jgi:hypothetical protein
MGHIFKILLKLIILMTNETLKINVVKMKQWPYCINVYYKYWTLLFFFRKLLYIGFVEITIIGAKKLKSIPKII